MSTQAKLEAAVEAAKAAPATTVVGMTILGYPLSEATAFLAFVLIVLQLIFLIKEKIWDKRHKETPDAKP